MPARSQGPLSTILLLAPLTAVPMFAIFGIPQLAPVQPLNDREGDELEWRDETPSLGEANAFPDSEPLPEAIPSDPFARTEGVQPAFYDGRAAARNSDAAANGVADSAASRNSANVSRGEPAANTSTAAGLLQPFPQSSPRSQSEPMRAASMTAENSTASVFPVGLQSAEAAATEAAVPVPNAPPQVTTWQEAVSRLEALGVSKYRLEPSRNPREFLFVCSFETDSAARITRRFEAVSQDPLDAVTQVIAQVESWSKR